MTDSKALAALSDARYFGAHAKDYIADGWPQFAGWLASRAAHFARLAVPSLRDEK